MAPTGTHPFDRIRARFMAGAGLVVSLAIAIAFAIAGVAPDTFETAWVYTLIFALLCPALAWWGVRRGLDVRRVFGTLPRQAGAWAATLAPLLAVLGVASLLMVALGIWSYFAPDAAVEMVNDRRFANREPFGENASTFATTVAAVIVAPMAEEFVFRGLLMQRWIRKWGLWKGVLASSAVFGALHLTYAPLAALTGVVLALLYLATGSLWVPIAAHALNNAFVSLLRLVPERQEQSIALAELRGEMLASVLFAALCAMALYRLRPYLWPSPAMPVPYGASPQESVVETLPARAEANYLIVLRPARPEMVTEGPTPAEEELIERHFQRLRELSRAGVVRLAGRTMENDERTLGLVLVAASCEAEARAIMDDDPAVRGGVMTAELHPFREAVAD